jgi:trimeric autotransporter adhesin
MQTWAKRGLQTALVTGGLLMLGTGIASADEDVNPDKPASPLDGSVSVPVHMHNNAVGTPLGSQGVSSVHKDPKVRADDLTSAVPAGTVTPVANPTVDKAKQAAADLAAPAVGKILGAAPLSNGARDQAEPLQAKTKLVTDRFGNATDRLGNVPGGDRLSHLPSLDKVDLPAAGARDGEHLSGNVIHVDVVMPIDISGNAIAVLGKAAACNDSSQSYGHNHDIATSGEGGMISGNVVDADLAVPVQITNNAIAILGEACADGTSSQEAWATGDIVTNGDHSLLGGNVVAPQVATPVQVTGNAVSALGFAHARSTADTVGQAGGFILTSGNDSVGGGNAVPVPVAVPAKLNGNAITALGKSIADADTTADAQAGDTRIGKYGVPTYVETSGAQGLVAGTIAQPAASGPVLLCGNSGGAGGLTDATCVTGSETDAGGTNRSTGEGAIGSGAIAAAPIVLPVSGFGNAPIALGTAIADATNTNDSKAGGDSYTRGHDSVLSGTTANASPAGPIDVFSNPIVAVGKSTTTAENTTTTTSGGNTGTTGDNSVGGGTMGTVPVASPGELYGNLAAIAGSADSTVTEDKVVTAGGGSNTADDNGLLASNLVNVPVATAAQAFGNGAGVAAVYDTQADTVNKVTAGGPSKATGTAGSGAGNIVQAPVSMPVQAFGTGVSALAKGTQAAVNEIDSKSGGDATSDGTNALAGGNVLSVPAGGAGQAYGESVAALGANDGLAGSVTDTEAGGDTSTSGQGGTASGNVVSPQAMPAVQSFAAVVSGVGGINSSTATNQTDAGSGGDIDTNGDSGSLSGNLVDVPAAAVVQPFGDAVSAVGSKSTAAGYGDTQGVVGGTSTTSGNGIGSLSGLDVTLPVGANAPVYDVPVEVLAQAITESANTSNLQVGEGEPQLDLPVGGGIAPTEVPSLMRGARPMPANDPVHGVFSGVLAGVSEQDQVTDVFNIVSRDVVAESPVILPAPLPGPTARTAAGVPVQGLLGGVLGGPLGGHVGGDLLGGNLAGVGGLASGGLLGGGQRELPQAAPDFARLLSPLSTILPTKFGGFGRSAMASPLAYAPVAGDLTDVTTILPALPADVTAILPVIPAAPIGTDVPLVQAPGVGEVSPRMEMSTLDSTRAALANLFTTHPIG